MTSPPAPMLPGPRTRLGERPFAASLSREGWLGAAAQLDALGVEVLGHAESTGLAERDLRLIFQVRIAAAPAGWTIALPFADFATVERAARAAYCCRFGCDPREGELRFVSVLCHAESRPAT